MVLSMAVIGVGASLLYSTLPNDESQDPVQEISYEVELTTAGRAAPYALMAPEGLTEAWRATSVNYQHQSDHGTVWHLGFMDPTDQYVAVEQGDGDRDKFIAKVTHQARETSRTEEINGQEWIRYEGEKYDALVRAASTDSEGGEGGEGSGDSTDSRGPDSEQAADDVTRKDDVTTLVTGTASPAQLKKMAAALEPQVSQG